jgi:hypothetical protein
VTEAVKLKYGGVDIGSRKLQVEMIPSRMADQEAIEILVARAERGEVVVAA